MFFNSNYIIYVSKKKIIILSKTFSLLPCKCYVVLYLSYIISIITIIQLFNIELKLRKKKFLKVQSFFFSKLPLTSFDLVKLTFYNCFPILRWCTKILALILDFEIWNLYNTCQDTGVLILKVWKNFDRFPLFIVPTLILTRIPVPTAKIMWYNIITQKVTFKVEK